MGLSSSPDTDQNLSHIVGGGRRNPGADSSERTSANGAIVVKGPQELYATPALIEQANARLRTVGAEGSFIVLVAGAGKLQVDGQTLVQVVPMNKNHWAPDEKAPERTVLPDACVSVAQRVGGHMSKRSKMRGIYDQGGKERRTNAAGNDGTGYSGNMYLSLMPAFVMDPANETFLNDAHMKGIWNRGPSPPKDEEEARAYYDTLSAKGKEKFDRRAGINNYADPEIGDMLVTSTEPGMPGYEEPDLQDAPKQWGSHWAGIVMKDGSDYVTLENFQHENPKSWFFRLYGSGEDSFHDHRVDSGAHANRATTMVVRAE